MLQRSDDLIGGHDVVVAMVRDMCKRGVSGWAPRVITAVTKDGREVQARMSITFDADEAQGLLACRFEFTELGPDDGVA